MRILVVGGGGREHALCWAIWASPLCDALYCAPGNAGIAELATCVAVAADDVEGLVRLARAKGIDFVVVGPEAPLANGLVDRLEEAGIKAFGPTAAAAELEGSKAFMKELCRRHRIPTAASATFRDFEAAAAYIRAQGGPLVVKASGLAAGKGVVVAETEDEALVAARAMLVEKAFGAAGAEVVIEEWLEGEEVSFFALVDGAHTLPLASVQDHKRIGEGDAGPNTGGMGAYSPAPPITAATESRIMAEIINPAVHGMAAEGRPFTGVLFAGLMMTKAGPKVLEFNVRFGDPECQALVVRLKSDLLSALLASRDGMLGSFDLRWREEVSLCVVMAARGYPGPYPRGSEIKGLADAAAVEGVTIFHAGTRFEGDRIVSDGGRVLGITALGRDLREARARAYEAVSRIEWKDAYFRKDIGWRALAARGAG